jgi:DNA polymerase-4
MSRAVRLCPDLVILRPDFSKYAAVSQQVFAIFRSVTPLVEPLSLDEAYLDVTENAWGEPLGVDVARRLKSQIRGETRLTASAGVAPNKFLAKIASAWKKPDGLTVISPERIEGFLQRLPVDALWGVGPKTAAKLRAAGIDRLVDVRTASPELLDRIVGKWAAGSRSARTTGPSSPTASASRSAARRRMRRTWTTPGGSRRRSRGSPGTPRTSSNARTCVPGRSC